MTVPCNPNLASKRRNAWLAGLGAVLLLIAALAAYGWFAAGGIGFDAPPPGSQQALFGQGGTGGGAPKGIDALAHLLLALAAVIVASRALGFCFQVLGQPPVVGEMVAGILLGPSLLGHYWPDVSAQVFPASTASSLNALGQIGVILFMFLVGVHLDPSSLRSRARAVVTISQASIAVPFAMGAALALVLYRTLATSDVPLGVFVLFMGLSMSVTAFPVLARILTDRGLAGSRLGSMALACAALNDVTAWCLLALVISVAKSNFGDAFQTFSLCLVFVAFMILAVRPVMAAAARRAEARGEVGHGMLGFVAVALLLSALATQWMGVHALFGAFLLGVIVPSEGAMARHLRHCLHDVTVVFLLPAYFAFTGLRTQVGLIEGVDKWLLCGVIVIVASLGKTGGTILGARLVKLPWRDATVLGALMNTRGLMEIIVLNVGLDLRVLSPTLFSMLVLMAIATTIATTPALNFLYRERKDDLDLGESKASTRSA